MKDKILQPQARRIKRTALRHYNSRALTQEGFGGRMGFRFALRRKIKGKTRKTGQRRWQKQNACMWVWAGGRVSGRQSRSFSDRCQ